MNVTLNGERHEVTSGDTLLSLIEGYIGIAVNGVVVEYNGHIVDRTQYNMTTLSEGDVVEIVRFVGGG